jgi:hypothetical protein
VLASLWVLEVTKSFRHLLEREFDSLDTLF